MEAVSFTSDDPLRRMLYLEAVAGGDDDRTVFVVFVDWLLQLPTRYPDDPDKAPHKIPLIG